MEQKKIKTALISVFYKDGLDEVIDILKANQVEIFSTGGTQKFIEELNCKVTPVETLTSYPSILGGRVKTLHPKIFGGILSRRDNNTDLAELETYEIPEIDLVIVDLYPFEETVQNGSSEQEIIEKIDIGGISLIRAAAKNYKDTTVISSRNQYNQIVELLNNQNGQITLEQRKEFALQAFGISSHYDTHIYQYFEGEQPKAFKASYHNNKRLRYGENPHQNGWFYGDINRFFDQLHGKELSYNNLLDVDAAVSLMTEFKNDNPTFAILKHNNACGIATRNSIYSAYKDALAGDPVSAFGGILICNKEIDKETAEEIHKLFCEVVIAPKFNQDALEILKGKKNRILLTQKIFELPKTQFRTILNGVLVQDRDNVTDKQENFKTITKIEPSEQEKVDLEFASKICKHTKSNTIVLAKNGQLLASGTGQTSRVDALKQAIQKAKSFNFDLEGAVMASDAFFPFPDCVEIAQKEGIKSVIQPGGSIKDQLSIDFCDQHNMSMVFTGTRHFKH